MKTLKLLLLLILSGMNLHAQTKSDGGYMEKEIVLETPTGKLYGTLTLPNVGGKVPIVLFIAGSGPTDRNGNTLALGSNPNSILQLAHTLASANIASLRYDKRGIGESADAARKEADLRFENYIEDASAWLALLKKDSNFSEFIVAGHSEGSLIGMEVAQKADKYISLAGAGEPADIILKKQLAKQTSGALLNEINSNIDSLKNGDTLKNVNPNLQILFRSSVQPYLISWFRYDPQTEIKKLHIPILIVQGAKDLQISVYDAQNLKNAQPSSTLVLIDGMNHVLKNIKGDDSENLQSYSNPLLPIEPKLVTTITNFIQQKSQ